LNPLRILYIFLGLICFGLAAAGAFVPVLPTTPFLLLASFFFSRGSARFDRWFTSTKLYQDHLDSFIKSRSMTRKTKVYILTLATIMMCIPLIFVPIVFVKVFMASMIVFMHYYFSRRIKTIKPSSGVITITENEAWRASDKSAAAEAQGLLKPEKDDQANSEHTDEGKD